MVRSRTRRAGLTLAEMIVVLFILVALAGIVIPLLSSQSLSSGETVTRTNLTAVRDAVIRYRIDNPSQTPDLVRVGDLFARKTGLGDWNPIARTGWRGPYLHSTGAVYAYTGIDGFDAAYGTGTTGGDGCVFDGYAHTDGRRRPIVLVSRTVSPQTYCWLQSAGADGVLLVPTALTGPPITSTTGSGSDFPTSSGVVHVDDLTMSVYP